MDASRRDQFKSSAANVASQRRRKMAVTLGKERRDAAVRAKRIRRSTEDENMEIFNEDYQNILENEVKDAVADLITANHDTSKGAYQRRLEALRRVRKLLSSSSLPPIDIAVEAGIIPILVDCLAFGSTEEQLLEAAWCLTNIASGDVQQTKDMLTFLIAHLGENSPPLVAEQCAWALGNIAGDSEEMRNILLAQGALRPLARLISSTNSSLACTACWSLSNLIKGPSFKAASELMKIDGVLQALLGHIQTEDQPLIAEAAWVLVYISALWDTKALVEAGVLSHLVKWLANSDQLMILTPVLRTIGNVVCGDDTKTDAVVASGSSVPGGITGALSRCLNIENRALQKEALWVISNICAGTTQHKELIYTTLTTQLINLLSNSTFDIRKEAAYALGNMCVSPREEGSFTSKPLISHLTSLVQAGCVLHFVNLVKLPDYEAAKLGLQFLELVMRSIPVGPKLVENCDGMLAIEMLNFHENEELRNMSNYLMDTYYGEDYDFDVAVEYPV